MKWGLLMEDQDRGQKEVERLEVWRFGGWKCRRHVGPAMKGMKKIHHCHYHYHHYHHYHYLISQRECQKVHTVRCLHFTIYKEQREDASDTLKVEVSRYRHITTLNIVYLEIFWECSYCTPCWGYFNIYGVDCSRTTMWNATARRKKWRSFNLIWKFLYSDVIVGIKGSSWDTTNHLILETSNSVSSKQ